MGLGLNTSGQVPCRRLRKDTHWSSGNCCNHQQASSKVCCKSCDPFFAAEVPVQYDRVKSEPRKVCSCTLLQSLADVVARRGNNSYEYSGPHNIAACVSLLCGHAEQRRHPQTTCGQSRTYNFSCGGYVSRDYAASRCQPQAIRRSQAIILHSVPLR